MLPLRGEATLSVGCAKKHTDWADVIGVGEDGDLLLSRSVTYKIGEEFKTSHELEWASEAGEVKSFDPERQIVPAASGWVARTISVVDGKISSVVCLPIVGWALPTAHRDGEPVVFECPTKLDGYGVTLLSKSSAAACSSVVIDAIYFDPTANTSVPEIDNEYVLDMVG